jgi:hypothetical protein
MEKAIKVTLAILFFICLADMPYGYFQLVRTLAMIGFAVLAYNANERGENNLAILFVGLAILFQPLIKIPLGRELWNIVDVIVGVGLLISVFWKKK